MKQATSRLQQEPLRRIGSLGSLVEGSGWGLRARPPAPAAASGNLGTWKSGNLEIWGPGNPEMWGPKNQKNKNSQNSNPFCQKCRQGLVVRKNPPGPIWGHPKSFFPWTDKIRKHAQKLPIFFGGPMGPIHPVWALAAIHPRSGNRCIFTVAAVDEAYLETKFKIPFFQT